MPIQITDILPIVESVALLCYILLLVIRSPVAKYLIISVAVACSTCVYPVLWPERNLVAEW